MYYYCNTVPYYFHILLILFVVWIAQIFGIVLKQSWDSVGIVSKTLEDSKFCLRRSQKYTAVRCTLTCTGSVNPVRYFIQYRYCTYSYEYILFNSQIIMCCHVSTQFIRVLHVQFCREHLINICLQGTAAVRPKEREHAFLFFLKFELYLCNSH